MTRAGVIGVGSIGRNCSARRRCAAAGSCYRAAVRSVVLLLALSLAACKSSGGEQAGPGPGTTVGSPVTPGTADGRAKPDVPADDQSRFDQERQPEQIVAALQLKPGMVIADVGAGTGLLTVHVARAVYPSGRVVATDIDTAVLDYLSARMEAAGYDSIVEARKVAPTDPGLEKASYDVILLAQVDHYFDDRVAWLTRAAPALKPGGRLAITNRMQHRAPAVAAAEAVGFHLVTEVNDLPGQFVALFERDAAPKKGTP